MADGPIKLICHPDQSSVERRRRRTLKGIVDRGGDYVHDEIVSNGKLFKYLVTQPYFFPLNGAPIPRGKQVIATADRIEKRDAGDHHPREHIYALLARKGLWVYEGYRWDGPSGPTIPTEDAMQGSLLHDAIYQMMREEVLPADRIRPRYLIRAWADWQFRRILKEDGMIKPRRVIWFHAVRKFAAYAAEPPVAI